MSGLDAVGKCDLGWVEYLWFLGAPVSEICEQTKLTPAEVNVQVCQAISRRKAAKKLAAKPPTQRRVRPTKPPQERVAKPVLAVVAPIALSSRVVMVSNHRFNPACKWPSGNPDREMHVCCKVPAPKLVCDADAA